WTTQLEEYCQNFIALIFHTLIKDNIVKIRNQKVQKQKGYNDCALFAIAFATTLCHGEDLTTKRYGQRAMRPHLVYCLESSRMTEFPTTNDTVELVHPVNHCNCPTVEAGGREFIQRPHGGAEI
ncbi:unnamed protein product, partial [Porites lobata]